MIAEMHKLRDELEHGVVGDAAAELAAIFDLAEIKLASHETLFNQLLTDPDGKIQNVAQNLEHVSVYFRDDLNPRIEEWIVGPGKAWAEQNVPIMHKAGRRLASVNLDVAPRISPNLVKAAFDNVSVAEQGILKVGYTDGYQIMNTVGDDVGTWFRQTMQNSVIEGIPVSHHNPNVDSLQSRLVASGRIKPLTIVGKNGVTYHRSVKQRAQAIARIESTRIINRTHETLAEEAIGEEAVFRNSNPQDSRSTDICEFASQQKAMSLEEWDNSTYGRPPRLSPFHLCRSVLIAGRAEWFDEVPEADLQGAGLAKTTFKPPKKKTSRQAAAQSTQGAAQAALSQAATAAATELANAAKAAQAAKKAAQAAKVAQVEGQIAGKMTQAASLDLSDAMKNKTFSFEAPPMAAGNMKPLVEQWQKVVDLPDASAKTALWKTQYQDAWETAILKAQKPYLAKFDDFLPDAQTSWKIQVKKDAFAKMSDSGIFTEVQLKARANEIFDLQKTQILEFESLATEAFQAQDQHKLDLIQHNLGKIPFAEAAAAEVKVKGLIDDLAEALSVGPKVAEYNELLDGLALGKFGPKKTITVTKKVQKLADEINDLGGVPGSEGGGLLTELFPAKVLNAADDLAAASAKLDAAYPSEVVAFAEEYQKVVTSKKIPLADAAVIFDKYKAGLLKGKASAKAKQAADAVKAKLSVTPPPAAAAPKPPAPLAAELDEFAKVDKAWDQIDTETEFTFDSTANIGGAHSKEFWLDSNGDKWLFKPFASDTAQVATFRGMVDEFAYKMQRMVDPAAAEARFAVLSDGRRGSIQRWLDGATGDMKGQPLSAYTPTQIATVQREHVLDWLLSNHDGHGGQFIRFPNGKLVGVDKGQAYKFFDDDVLDFDYHPNRQYGESEPIFNTLMKSIRAGNTTVDPKVTLGAIEQFEKLTDNNLRDMLNDYSVARWPRDQGARTRFIEKVVARKNALRADFEEYYQRALKDPTFTFGETAAATAPEAVSSSVAGAQVKKFGVEGGKVLDSVSDAGYQGRELQIQGFEFEDQSVLFFEDILPDGSPRTNVVGKTLDGSRSPLDKKLVDFFESQDVTRATAPSRRAAPVEAVGQALAVDDFADTITQAIVSVNSHMKPTGDKIPNPTTITKLLDLKPKLQPLLTHVDPDVAKMAELYLGTIEDIQDAIAGHAQVLKFDPLVSKAVAGGQTHFDPFKRRTLFKPPEPTAAAAAPVSNKLAVDLSQPRMTLRESRDGRLHVLREDGTLNEAHPRFDNSGVQYSTKLEDGTIVRYRPWKDANGNETNSYYAQRGELEVIVPGKPSAVTGDRALQVLEDLGVDVKPPTPIDREFVYLSKQAYTSLEHTTPKYQAMLAALPADATAAVKVDRMRKYWSDKLGVPDVTKLAQYRPEGQFAPSWNEWRTKGAHVDAGRRFWYRFDVDASKFDADMSELHIHQYTEGLYSSSDESTLAFLRNSLGENGSLLSTRERMRVGIKAGESPGSDMRTGGANYVYTRLRDKSPGRRGSQGLAWKNRTVRRLDAISYNGDEYGDVTGTNVVDKRATGLKGDARSWVDWSREGSNETLFKYDMSLLEDIEAIVFSNKTSVDEAVKLFHDQGITRLPDGRTIEEIIMTDRKFKTRKST